MSSGPGGSRARQPEHEIWVVGRLQGGVAVLVEDLDRDAEELPGEEGEATRMVVEVAAALLGSHAEEGAVLRVPIGEVGEPMWESAERDPELEAELRQQSAQRILDADRDREG